MRNYGLDEPKAGKAGGKEAGDRGLNRLSYSETERGEERETAEALRKTLAVKTEEALDASRTGPV